MQGTKFDTFDIVNNLDNDILKQIFSYLSASVLFLLAVWHLNYIDVTITNLTLSSLILCYIIYVYPSIKMRMSYEH